MTLMNRKERRKSISPETVLASRTCYVIVCNTRLYDQFYPDIYPFRLSNEFVYVLICNFILKAKLLFANLKDLKLTSGWKDSELISVSSLF